MKTLLVYYSYHHGNTKKVAEVLAGELSADLADLKNGMPSGVEQYDLIGVGSGIYMGGFHEEAKRFLQQAPLRGKRVFLFCTSGMGVLPSAKTKALREESGAIAASEFGCKGFDTYSIFNLVRGIAKGHPNEEDLASARAFAAKLRDGD